MSSLLSGQEVQEKLGQLEEPLIDKPFEPQLDPNPDTNNDVDSRRLRNSLFSVWAISFLTAIDGTVAIPSLWRYIESLGGDEEYYGTCVSIFAIARVICMGPFGIWVDNRPFREIFATSLVLSMVASVIYAMGPTVGIHALLVSRFLLGGTSAVSVATQAFVSEHTSKAERTKYTSINSAIITSLSVCGPVFNLVIVALPEAHYHLGKQFPLEFTDYTWVGYFLCACQGIVLIGFLHFFTEPTRVDRRKPKSLGQVGRCLTLGGLFPWPRFFLDPWLYVTHSWSMIALAFRTNSLNYAVTYAIPLITARDYDYGQLGNSYVFCVASVLRIISTGGVAKLSMKISDRVLIVFFEGCTILLLLALLIPSKMTTLALPMPLFVGLVCGILAVDPGPVVVGLYSKLIGPGNAGLYFAVLQSNGAIARALFGQLVGFAYGSLGPIWLWSTCGLLVLFSSAVLLTLWRQLKPSAIEVMHDSLESHQQLNLAAVPSSFISEAEYAKLDNEGGGGYMICNRAGMHSIEED